MANDSKTQSTDDLAEPNPSVNPKTGEVDPSAPTIGTEGWGNTSDERRTLSRTEPSATRSGQMKENPGDQQSEMSKHKENSARSDKTPSSSTSASSGKKTFRCADVGGSGCQWETSAATDDEIIEQAKEHAQREHGWRDWTEAMSKKVRDAIRERQAA